MKVALLYGGRSGEHEVSLRSAASVYNHIDKTKHQIILIGIDKDGIWYLQEEALITEGSLELKSTDHLRIYMAPGKGFFLSDKTLNVDIVYPVLHGTFGEDGTLQGMLDMLEMPYVGAGVAGSYTGMDKEFAKIIWQSHNLPVVPFITLHKGDTPVREDIEKTIGYPLFIKPCRTGSSVGVGRVENWEEFQAALHEALRFDTKVLIEPGLNIREIECAVIGNTNITVFPPGEIAPTHDTFYSYDAKYIDPDGAALIIPAKLPPLLKERIMEIAEKAYKTVECRGLARLDIFLEKETDTVYINEINTLPGCTSISMFPMLCENGGLPYSSLLDSLLKLGMEEFKTREALSYRI